MKLSTYAFGFLLCTATQVMAQSPYINKVYEYCPAPGQFINLMPEYELGDTKETMRQKAETALANNAREMICLGGWGGYVTFGFDHMVENRRGQMDFAILGNAFYATGSNPSVQTQGSSEPGIVMVSHDSNGNGEPDDPWYELAGSEYNNPLTIHEYSITYKRPDNDSDNITWEDNKGNNGLIYHNTYYSQSYYPLWEESSTISFRGVRLPDNGKSINGNANNYVLSSFAYGYADNYPNTEWQSTFNIEWAVDSNGQTVNLPGIHFVRIYCGINQTCGMLGETSTEVAGATDLHLVDNTEHNDPTSISDIHKKKVEGNAIFDLTGCPVKHTRSGRFYIFKRNGKITKGIVRAN